VTVSISASADVIRIMPLGDSITLGGVIAGGYRQQLYIDLIGAVSTSAWLEL